jgi:hypothetical protein
VINPEQTASIFSFAFFFFVDRIIFLAYRESQLQEEELYPLCDSDASAHLKNTSFKAGVFRIVSLSVTEWNNRSIWTNRPATFSSDYCVSSIANSRSWPESSF